jgi:hypothetical protein
MLWLVVAVVVAPPLVAVASARISKNPSCAKRQPFSQGPPCPE